MDRRNKKYAKGIIDSIARANSFHGHRPVLGILGMGVQVQFVPIGICVLGEMLCVRFVAKAPHAINPNITVTMNVAPSKQYWQKLQTTTVAGTAPDVFWINYPNFPKYFNSNTLLNLSPYIEKSTITNISNYPASLMKKYTQNGAVYAIPEQFDTIILAYNKDLFDEAGIAYPDDTWTCLGSNGR